MRPGPALVTRQASPDHGSKDPRPNGYLQETSPLGQRPLPALAATPSARRGGGGMSKERAAGHEAALVRIEAAMATKADLAGVAKNVDVTALGRQLREMRDELRVTSAMVLRLDHMWPDVIQQLRAMPRFTPQVGVFAT